jgi:hypothetical protein
MNPVQLALRVLRGDSRSRMSALFTAIGVAIGVVLVLWLAAVPSALQSRADRESWRHGGYVSQGDPAASLNMISTRDDVGGKRIERLDVAALKPNPRVASGIPKIPGPGEVLLSPALAELAGGMPADRLADRFPGKVIGTIGEGALMYPDELVAMVGHTPDELPGNGLRKDLVGRPGSGSVDALLVLLTQIGLIVLVAPCLVLVASAARLTAARRERRLAALRLAGATPQQIVSMTVAETAIAAIAGTVLGLLLDIPLRSLTALVPWNGGTWYPADLTPSPALVVLVAVLTPLLVVGAAILGLRRVISRPLGAAQQTMQRAPNAARLLWLMGAGVIFLVGLGMAKESGGTETFVLFGLAAVALSLVLIGPLVTASVGKFFTKTWRSAPTLLAGRRLRDDPKAAFRASSGVVLAVFAGSMALAMFPGLESQIGHSSGKWQDGVYVAQNADLTDKQLASLRGDFAGRGVDASVVQIVEGSVGNGYSAMVISCADAAKVLGATIGTCGQGPAIYVPTATALDTGTLRFTPNSGEVVGPTPLPKGVAVREYQPRNGVFRILIDSALLPPMNGAAGTVAVVTNPQNEEIVHTLLVRNLPGISLYNNEKYDSRGDTLMGDLRRATLIGLAIATVLGGVSAGVAAAGSVVDRRRTFGALIAAGTPVRVLTKALRREAMLPAIVATVGGSVAGVIVGGGLLTLIKEELTVSPWLVTPAVLGLVVALLAAAACGPVLRKVTAQAYAEE